MAEQNPLAKYALKKFGGGRRNTEGMFTNINGNAARDARRTARREQRPMTFAEMQSDGVARPGPMDNVAAAFAGPEAANMDGIVGQDIVPQQAAPIGSQYAGPMYNGGSGNVAPTQSPPNLPDDSTSIYSALRAAALENLQAQFGAQRQNLEETLARRGLAASTYGGGMLGDLAGQQSRTMAQLEADLLAQDYQRRLASYEMALRAAGILRDL